MFPNWLRMYVFTISVSISTDPYDSIPLILTFLSFLPQIHLIRARKDASGIALSYILLNLIAATEQFALNFGYTALNMPSSGVFVHKSLIFGDWLNLAQTTLVWMLFVV
jgi:uncharacterized protein with PQ loop repeat